MTESTLDHPRPQRQDPTKENRLSLPPGTEEIKTRTQTTILSIFISMSHVSRNFIPRET